MLVVNYDTAAMLVGLAVIFMFGVALKHGVGQLRFSLRTMLVATTLVAVILGLIVASR